LHNFQPLSIIVNGQTQSIGAQTQLTPAEAVAVSQVLNTNHQSLLLGAGANAVGGMLTLNTTMAAHLSELVIPRGVTVVDLFKSSSTFSINGSLLNDGSMYTVSTNPSITNVSISALNITNERNGLITTSLPQGGLSGFAAAQPNVSLSLNAADNLSNQGKIASSANLTLSAGGSISNSAAASISAVNNINLNSNSGNFTNAGAITSNTGNITFASGQLDHALTINNTGGTIQALCGEINVGNASSKLASFALNGGDWLSQSLNANTGTGAVNINVGLLSGVVNVKGGSLAINAETPDLDMGLVQVSGDPTLLSTGSVTLPASANGEPYIVIAGGDITAGSTTSINTSGTASGGNVVLVAGANYIDNTTLSRVTVSGASATGGQINLSGVTTITTGGGDGTGGNLTLVAFASPGHASSGLIIADSLNAAINTSGSPGNANGQVTIVAGGTSSAANPLTINVGDIDTHGGTSGTGAVTIQTATPKVSAATPVVISVDQPGSGTGAISSGTFSGGAVQSGAVQLGNLTTGGAAIQIVAGTNAQAAAPAISTGALMTNAGLSTANNAGSVNISAGSAGTGIRNIATGLISTASLSIKSDGGDIGTFSNPITIQSIAGGGSTIALTASGNNVFISDSTAGDTVSMVGTSSSSASGQFRLVTDTASNINIIEGSTGVISSSNLSLYCSSNLGTQTVPIQFKSSANGTTQLIATGQSAFLQDSTTNETVNIITGIGGKWSLSVTGSNSNIMEQVPDGFIVAPTIVLNAPQGKIGTLQNPIQFDSNGSGTVSLTATAAGSVYLQDPVPNETISLVGTSSTGATGLFRLVGDTANGVTIAEGAGGLISSPSISLYASATVGTQAAPVAVQTNAPGNLTLSSAGGSSFIIDAAKNQNVNVQTGIAEAGGQWNLNVSGTNSNINEVTSTGFIVSPAVALTAAKGNIGTLQNPILFDSNGSGTASLTVAASGSVFLKDPVPNETISIVGTNSAGAGAQFRLVGDTAAGINITEGAAGLISSPNINLYASVSVGSAANPLLIQSGGAGTVSLTAAGQSVFVKDSTANENVQVLTGIAEQGGQWNLSVTGAGSNITEQPSLGFIVSPTIVLNSAQGSIGTLQNQIQFDSNGSGNVNLTATANGSVFLKDPIANETITIVGQNTSQTGQFRLVGDTASGINIVEGSSGVIASPTISLYASASIGTLGNPVIIQSGGFGTVTLTSSARSSYLLDSSTSENVAIQSGIGELGGQWNLSVTGAGSNITEVASTGFIASPAIVLNATQGSIGSMQNHILFDSNGSGTVSITATAGADVFLKDQVANEKIQIVGLNSSGAAKQFRLVGDVAANVSILEGVGGVISSPTISLYASGTVGALGNPVAIQSGTAGGGTVALIADGHSVFVQDSTNNDNVAISTGIAQVGGQWNLSVTGTTAGISEVASTGFIASPAIVLNASQGSIGSMANHIMFDSNGSGSVNITATAGADVFLKDPTAHENVYIVGVNSTGAANQYRLVEDQAASVNIYEGNLGVIESPTISVYASGTVGTASKPVLIQSGGTGSVTLIGDGNSVYLSDSRNNDSVNIQGGISQAGGQWSLTVSGSNSNINEIPTTGFLATPTFVLHCSFGSIGSFVNPIQFDSNGSGLASITVTAANSIFMEDPAPNDKVMFVGTSSTGVSGQFRFVGDIAAGLSVLEGTAGLISSPTISLYTNNNLGAAAKPVMIQSGGSGTVSLIATGNSVFLQDPANNETVSVLTAIAETGGQWSLTTSGSNSNIGTDSGLGFMVSPQITLTALHGNVGTAAFPVQFDSNGNGTVGITIKSSGSVFMQDPILNENVSLVGLNSSGATGQFSLLANSMSGMNIIEGLKGVISSPTIMLGASGNIGTSTTPLSIASSGTGSKVLALTAAAQSVFLQDSAAGDNVSIVSGAAQPSGQWNLNVTGTASNITGSTLPVGSFIQAANISLSDAHGSIGTAASPIQFDSSGAGTANLNVVSGANVYANDPTANDVLVLSGSAVSVLNVSANAAISTTGSVSAGVVNLQAKSGNSSITIGGNLTGESSVSLSANGNGGVSQTGGSITGNLITLSSAVGDIGNFAGKVALNTAASTLAVNSTGGNVIINNSGTGVLTLNSSSAGGTFDLSTNKGLTLNIVSTASGSISLGTATGALTSNAGSSLFANEGNVLLQNQDNVAGSISLGVGSHIEAYTTGTPGLGNVTVVVGAVPASPVAGTKPADLVVNASGGGQVFFGSKGISAMHAVNVLNAIGGNITFDTNGAAATKIMLNGGVTITADPPVTGQAATSNPLLGISQSFSSSRVPNPNALSDFTNVNGYPQNAMLANANTTNATPSHFANGNEFVSALINQSAPDITPIENTQTNNNSQVSVVSNAVTTAGLNTLSNPVNTSGLNTLSNPANASLSNTMSNPNANIQTIEVPQHDHSDFILSNQINGMAQQKQLKKVAQLKHSLVKYLNDSDFSRMDDGALLLKQGNILVAPKSGTQRINLQDLSLEVPAGTVVLIELDQDTTHIYNMCETSAASINVRFASETRSMNAGEGLIVLSGANRKLDSLQVDQIGRRNSRISTVGNLTTIQSEVPLASVLQKSILTQKLMRSNNCDDKRLYNKLLKMAACMSVLFRANGPYMSMVPRSTCPAQ